MSFYEQYKKSYYSQWGEEGIIIEILKRLKINFTKQWICEFGAWDGIKYSNTYYFVKNFNCNAVYIEGDKKRYNELLKTCEKEIVGNIISINKFVENNLDDILLTTNITNDFLYIYIFI